MGMETCIVKHNECISKCLCVQRRILVKEKQNVRAGDSTCCYWPVRENDKTVTSQTLRFRRDGQPIDPLDVLSQNKFSEVGVLRGDMKLAIWIKKQLKFSNTNRFWILGDYADEELAEQRLNRR